MNHTNFNRRHFILNPSHAPFLFAVAIFCARERLIIILKRVGTLYIILPLFITGIFMCSEIVIFDKGTS